MQEKYYDDINLGILKHMGSGLKIGLKILDVGCGTGLLGNEIRKKGNYVYGIDISEGELQLASKRLNKVKKIDITQSKFELPKDFDTIIFSDVLEHLKDPCSCLKNFKEHLKAGGIAVISVPNIACWNIRLRLLLGQFNYRDYGTLDDTHLRFFTKKTAKQLVEDSGYKIIMVDTTPYFIRSFVRIYKTIFFKKKGDKNINMEILNSKSFQFYKDFIFPIENFAVKLLPGLFAYQFIIIAKKYNEE